MRENLRYLGKDSDIIDLEETRRRIKILQRKIYKCCGTKQVLCVVCFDIHWRLEDLKEHRDKLKQGEKRNV